MIVDGKKIAAEIVTELKKRPRPDKFLAAILVGEDPASVSFLNQKKKIADELGVDFRLYKFPETVTQDELRKEVLIVADQAACGGIIVQLPLPAAIDPRPVLDAIPPSKDPDVLGSEAKKAFENGAGPVLPPAAGVVETVIQNTKYKIPNTKVAVLGLGFLVGRPVANWAKGKFKEVSLLDKGDNFSVLKNADIVVCGTGVPGLVKPEMLKENALVIDFGYGQNDGKPSGDFSADTKYEILNTIYYTPTPGGTGPILVAKLFENFYKLNAS